LARHHHCSVEWNWNDDSLSPPSVHGWQLLAGVTGCGRDERACLGLRVLRVSRRAVFGSVQQSVGTISGPVIGGLLSTISISAPFFVTAGILSVCAVTTCFFLPESLAAEKRFRTISPKSFSLFAGFRDMLLIQRVKNLFLIGSLFYASIEIYQFYFSTFDSPMGSAPTGV